MSQQQILLIVLAILIVGSAVAIGLIVFNDQSAAANRDGLTSDLLRLSVRARAYYLRPKNWGGGEKSFEGLTIDYLTNQPKNANGEYSVIVVEPEHAVLQGEGISIGSDGNPIKVTLIVFADSIGLSLKN
ncbi:MAG: hypothetical protein ACKVRP_03235 [Bacteroidota bacterium]